jgi:hypothetical protein
MHWLLWGTQGDGLGPHSVNNQASEIAAGGVATGQDAMGRTPLPGEVADRVATAKVGTVLSQRFT